MCDWCHAQEDGEHCCHETGRIVDGHAEEVCCHCGDLFIGRVVAKCGPFQTSEWRDKVANVSPGQVRAGWMKFFTEPIERGLDRVGYLLNNADVLARWSGGFQPTMTRTSMGDGDFLRLAVLAMLGALFLDPMNEHAKLKEAKRLTMD